MYGTVSWFTAGILVIAEGNWQFQTPDGRDFDLKQFNAAFVLMAICDPENHHPRGFYTSSLTSPRRSNFHLKEIVIRSCPRRTSLLSLMGEVRPPPRI